MGNEISQAILIIGIFLFIGTIISKPSKRYGVPALLLYMGLGFVFGNGNRFDFIFDYPKFVNLFAQFAIGIIVFAGGLATSFDKVKISWRQGGSLSSIGVIVTMVVVGIFSHLVFAIDLKMAMLLGAVLSATDAAAVFSILESKGLKLKENIAETLEFESSTNDPIAFFLVITLTTMVANNINFEYILIGRMILNIVLGLIVGSLIGLGSSYFLEKINFEFKGLYPLNILAVSFIVLGICQFIPANSLLSLYVAGVFINNRAHNVKKYSADYFEATSWLMQISLFVILGLQASPGKIFSFSSKALWVSFCLVFLARPIAVFISLLFSKSSLHKKVFISWVGLRGATPIAFALIPFTVLESNADMFFNISFLVVCISVMLQGTTLRFFAHRLKLTQ